jgi:uncharacterized protein (DUF305 family)
MTARNARRAAAALLILSGLSGRGVAHAQEEGAQPGAQSNAEIEALYWARQDSARMRFTEADVAFVTGMISHHAQALIMSELAPTHGASPSVETLAARIINAQRDEIALMQRWLADRGQPVPQVKIDGLDLTIDMSAPAGDAGMDHEAHAPEDAKAPDDAHMAQDAHEAHLAHEHNMPGMLTREQLEELAGAFGLQFDRLFLTYMIQHHSGAVTMVDDLFAVDGAGRDGAVFKLASDVQVDQVTEIERMTQMLDAMAEPDAGR